MSTTSPSHPSAASLAALALGRRLTLAGYFAAPVTIEHAEAEGDDMIFLRVRTQAGGLDEVPVPTSVLEQALDTASSSPGSFVTGEDLFMLIEASRIRLA
ncbi:MAG: hypothetical protein ACLGI8_06195 [Acidimicrobiia bacterium]